MVCKPLACSVTHSFCLYDPSRSTAGSYSDFTGGGARASRGVKRAATSSAGDKSKRAGGRSTASTVNTKTKPLFTGEDYEVAAEGECELQRWYARHNGFMPLSKENLVNSQSIFARKSELDALLTTNAGCPELGLRRPLASLQLRVLSTTPVDVNIKRNSQVIYANTRPYAVPAQPTEILVSASLQSLVDVEMEAVQRAVCAAMEGDGPPLPRTVERPLVGGERVSVPLHELLDGIAEEQMQLGDAYNVNSLLSHEGDPHQGMYGENGYGYDMGYQMPPSEDGVYNADVAFARSLLATAGGSPQGKFPLSQAFLLMPICWGVVEFTVSIAVINT